VVAQPKPLRFGLVKARHVADGSGVDQLLDNGRTQRTRAAGHNDMLIIKVHAPSSPIRRAKQDGCAMLRAGRNQWLISISP
jgi:hypothetical protein